MSDDQIGKLNELLEAERAGVRALAALAAEQPKGFLRNQFEKLGRDEAISCAGLVLAVRRLGGRPSGATGDFAEKVLALEGLPARLELLARGQAWVGKRLRALLDGELADESQRFLEEMLAVHVENIDWCNRKAAELRARSNGARVGVGA
jgi:nitronate monooxygenase